MPVFKDHVKAITGTKFDRTGNCVFSSSLDGYVRCWDAEQLTELRRATRKSRRRGDSNTQSVRQKVGCFTLGPTSEVFFGTFDGCITRWADDGLTQLGYHKELVTSLNTLRHTPKLVSSSLDRSVRLWDTSRLQYDALRTCAEGQDPSVVNMVACPTGDSILLIASEDGSIRSLDIRTNSVQGVWRAHSKAVTCLDVCSDGLRVLSGSPDTTALVWDMRVGKPLGDPLYTFEDIRSVAFSPDGSKFAVGTSGSVQLWDANLGIQLSRTERGHNGSVNSVSFSPDGNWAVTGGADHAVRIWTVDLLTKTSQDPKHETWPPMEPHHARDMSSLLSLATPEFPLGSGGFGEVYIGKWLVEDCLITPPPVVLKVLHKGFGRGGKRETMTRRLNREIALWQNLNSSTPNILPFFGISKNLGYFPASVSLYLENGTILAYVTRYPSVNRLNLLRGVACGLKYLHDKSPSIVHGDIKSDNILVTNHGIPYITDFGISRVLGDHPFWKTNTRTIKGSVRWMSPELLQESVDGVTVAADVYAFGITCWEILTGQIPFGEYPTEAAIVLQVGLNGAKPPHPRGVLEMSDRLWDLMTSCWNTTPKSRPSMSTVFNELTRLSASYRPLRLLSIVGGPLSAFAALGYLQAISARCGIKKPCDLFDLVAASGHGRILAYMLVELRMEIEDCFVEFVGLLVLLSTLECVSQDYPDTCINTSKFLNQRLQKLQARYVHQMDEWPSGSERCKMVLLGDCRLPSGSASRATNYTKCPYATPKCAQPSRGILEALLGNYSSSTPDPSLDLLEEARIVFGSHRQIGCFVRCGQNDGSNRLRSEAVDDATREEFLEIVESPNYFRFILHDQAIRERGRDGDDGSDVGVVELMRERGNHSQLAMMYRKLALAHMREDAQRAKLKLLEPLLLFTN